MGLHYYHQKSNVQVVLQVVENFKTKGLKKLGNFGVISKYSAKIA